MILAYHRVTCMPLGCPLEACMWPAGGKHQAQILAWWSHSDCETIMMQGAVPCDEESATPSWETGICVTIPTLDDCMCLGCARRRARWRRRRPAWRSATARRTAAASCAAARAAWWTRSCCPPTPRGSASSSCGCARPVLNATRIVEELLTFLTFQVAVLSGPYRRAALT